MPVRQTSLEAFNSIKDKLGEKQMEVYKAFEKGDNLSDQEIADILCWPINRITPRRNELENDLKLIVCLGTKVNSIGRKVRVYSLR